MIESGKICVSVIAFYNSKTGKREFKSRPVLVLAKIDHGDYAVLPVSRVTKTEYLHPRYDIPVTCHEFPALHLDYDSYIRTHKQTVINEKDITSELSDCRTEYPDLYVDILAHLEEFNAYIQDRALL